MSSSAPSLIDVLLVEDSPSDAALITAWLDSSQQLGDFRLCYANSQAEAVQRVHEQEFHVMLLDLGLGDSTGLDTLRPFTNCTFPIIVLTGMDDDQLAMAAMQQGAQDFLCKSRFDQNTLCRSIRYSIERHQLDRERTQLSRQLLTVVEDEQQRIARELHDEVGQVLSGLNMTARTLVRKLEDQGADAAQRATQISVGLQQALDSFRQVLCGLSPVDVDEQGLVVALRRLCEDVDLQADELRCSFEAPGDVTVADNTVASNLYRIAQESINNARKHAAASEIRVSLFRRQQGLHLEVRDNGHGFTEETTTGVMGSNDSNRQLDRPRPGKQMGLRILRHRADLIGGRLTIESGDQGTSVICEVEECNAQ